MPFLTRFLWPVVQPGDRYYHRWQRYRALSRRGVVWLFMFALAVPFSVAVESRAEAVLPGGWVTGLLVGMGVLGTVIMAPWDYLMERIGPGPARWPCPRCKRPFFASEGGGYHPVFRLLQFRCEHCGLAKWAPGGLEPPEPVCGRCKQPLRL